LIKGVFAKKHYELVGNYDITVKVR